MMRHLKENCHSEGEARRIPCVQKPTLLSAILQRVVRIAGNSSRSLPPHQNLWCGGLSQGTRVPLQANINPQENLRCFPLRSTSLRMTVVVLCIGVMLLFPLLGGGPPEADPCLPAGEAPQVKNSDTLNYA